jgi:enoyl-CoA hydratase
MKYRTLEYEQRDGVGRITLNRPEKRNAINDFMLEELDDLLRVKETDVELKVLVIRGAGPCFSVGQDLSGEGNAEVMPYDSKSKLSVRDALDIGVRWNRRLEYIFNYLKPIVAQVHGHCLGLGLYLTMVSDITVASEDAVFGDPSLRMGILTGLPLWTFKIGVKRTKELVYLGRYIDAAEAERICLINKVVPASQLAQEVDRYAFALSFPPGDGMAFSKESLAAQMEVRGVGAAWRFLSDMMAMSLLQRDAPAEEFDFWKTRDEKGLKAAIRERDAAIGSLFPAPGSPATQQGRAARRGM